MLMLNLLFFDEATSDTFTSPTGLAFVVVILVIPETLFGSEQFSDSTTPYGSGHTLKII